MYRAPLDATAHGRDQVAVTPLAETLTLTPRGRHVVTPTGNGQGRRIRRQQCWVQALDPFSLPRFLSDE